MGSEASQTQIVDLTGDEVDEIEEAGEPVLTHYNKERIKYGPSPPLVSQTPGPITRYVISSLAGFTLPRHATRD